MNLKQLLADSVSRRENEVAFRFKQEGEWHERTYVQFLHDVWRVSELLAGLGIRPGERVALYAENSVTWAAVYFGVVGLGATAVPVDVKLRELELAHILNDSQARILICGSKQYAVVRESHHQLRDVEHVFIIDGNRNQPFPTQPIAYHDFEMSLEEARDPVSNPKRAYDRYDPKDDEVASFIYTSGTTGRQKGAMLTHGNFTSNVQSCRDTWTLTEDDNFLLVLPLHHAFAFTGNLLLPIGCGASISLVESLRTVGENIREVSPTTFIGVPLLIEKMYTRIMDGLQKNRTAWLMWRIGLRAPIRRGIRQKLGGRLRMVVTGGAPCDPEILKGYRALGVSVIEGYGLTEAAPVLSVNPPDRPKPGTIGKPLVGVEITLLDTNPEGIGEIAARGPNVMKGYFNDEESTASAFRDNWLLTGDLGFIDDEGYITITGRKKSLIVNREGKNIHPEEVEAQILKSPYVLEALVLGYREEGDSVGERVGVIVVPNLETLDEDARRQGRPLNDRELVERMRQEVKTITRDISDYKRPRKIQVRVEEFEKTSTSKIKRYLYEMDAASVD